MAGTFLGHSSLMTARPACRPKQSRMSSLSDCPYCVCHEALLCCPAACLPASGSCACFPPAPPLSSCPLRLPLPLPSGPSSLSPVASCCLAFPALAVPLFACSPLLLTCSLSAAAIYCQVSRPTLFGAMDLPAFHANLPFFDDQEGWKAATLSTLELDPESPGFSVNT